jgi:hypothetical protein
MNLSRRRVAHDEKGQKEYHEAFLPLRIRVHFIYSLALSLYIYLSRAPSFLRQSSPHTKARKSVDIFGKIRHSARETKDDERGRGASIAAPRNDSAFEKK